MRYLVISAIKWKKTAFFHQPGSSREMEPVLHIKSYTCVIYVKELADTVVGAGKHQVFRADRQAENRQD